MIETLCRLNQAKLSTLDWETSKKELQSKEFPWDDFLDLMEFNRVSLLTLQRIGQLGVTPPEKVKDRFKILQDQCEKTFEKSEGQSACLEHVLDILGTEGVEVILLKGSMISAAFFAGRPYKKMNDVDLLIRKEDAQRAAEALKKEGFSSIGNPFGKKEISSSSHHMPPLVSPDLKFLVGLHWGLHSPHSPWQSDVKGIWGEASPIFFRNAQAYRMSWEDNLLHLCIHLPFFKTGLRELADVANLIIYGEIHWELIVERAELWRATSAVYRVLKLVSCLYPEILGQISESVWRTLRSKSDPFYRRDAEKRAVPELLLRSRSVYISKIEKSAVHLRLGSNFKERFNGWLGTLTMAFFVPPAEVKKLCLDDSMGSRVKAPLHILRAMCEDHGKMAMTYITAANIGILVKSTFFSALGLDRINPKNVNPQFRRLLEELE